MVFFNSTTEDAIVQEVWRTCSANSNSYSLKAVTARVNQAIDKFFTIALAHDKSWLFDDANQTDLPIGVTNLVSGQQDYRFASELLIVKSVLVADSNGVFSELEEETDPKNTLLLPTANDGTPTKFKLVGNSILLDFIPNYNATGGLKVKFARNGSKFVSTDTTKTPGIPSLFHPWLCWAASLPYLIENRLPNKNDIALLVQQGEKNIETFMATRNSTRKPKLSVKQQDNK